MAKRSNAGGGHGSRNVVEKPVRIGKGGRAQSPAAVNQLGAKVGDHITERRQSTGYRGEKLVRGEGYNPAPGFGNEVALNVKGGGPGVGRTIYKTGTQCMTGPVNRGEPMPKRELWPGWESKR
jgi:hypothetical protein